METALLEGQFGVHASLTSGVHFGQRQVRVHFLVCGHLVGKLFDFN